MQSLWTGCPLLTVIKSQVILQGLFTKEQLYVSLIAFGRLRNDKGVVFLSTYIKSTTGVLLSCRGAFKK
jgi:hypothetical protein